MAKINEYPQASNLNNNDLFVIDQTSGGDHATKSATMAQISQKATATLQTQVGDLSTLTTTDKSSLVGAVNELNKTATIPFTGASGLSTNNCQIFKRGVFLVVCIEIVLTTDQSGWYDILTTDTDVTLPSGVSLFGVVSTDSESIMPKYCQAYQSGTKMKVRIRNGKSAGQYRGQIIVPLG